MFCKATQFLIGALIFGGFSTSLYLSETIKANSFQPPPPTDYSPPGRAEILLPTTAHSSDLVADPYLSLHQDTWPCSGPTQMVGDVANPQDQYRRTKISASIIQSFTPFLGEPSQWHLITFGADGDSWCQTNVIWITGQNHHKLVCKMDVGKWILLSGPHGLAHLNAYLNQLEPPSWGLKERLHDILSFYGDRGLLAIGPDTDADLLFGHQGKNADQLLKQIKMLQSENRYESAADHTFVFECDVQTRESYWGDHKRAGLEKWTIKGTLEIEGIHISSIRYAPVHEDIFLAWNFMDDGL